MTIVKPQNEHPSSMRVSLTDLTPRELEILQLVIAGKTNKGIAREIRVSAKTVEFHLDNIYTKIGVRTRLMAGIWAIQNGLHGEIGFPAPGEVSKG
jgi:DNA-binding NarL/FixJ family response regulator